MSKLKDNRSNHLSEYKKAYSGYLISTVEELESLLFRAKNGDIQSRISFDEPKSHEDDYDTAIEMLEMSVDDELYITKEQFKCFVQDKWSWKGQFDLTNIKYLGK